MALAQNLNKQSQASTETSAATTVTHPQNNSTGVNPTCRGLGTCDPAGRHFIVDFWQATNLDDMQYIERALVKAVDAAGATLLHIHLHKFGGAGGITGVALLAESHISIHTWPEREYAAIDIFMCGGAKPELAVSSLQKSLQPARKRVDEIPRGIDE